MAKKDELIAKLQKILKKHFDGAHVDLERLQSKKIIGFLIWDKFTGKEQIKRQNKLWKVLDNELSPEERHKVAMIFTSTPAEREVISQD